MTNLNVVKLIDLMAKPLQEGGYGMADNSEAPLMKLRAEIVKEIHDPTTKEEYKHIAEEAIKTVAALNHDARSRVCTTFQGETCLKLDYKNTD